jgi:hypothetical protein
MIGKLVISLVAAGFLSGCMTLIYLVMLFRTNRQIEEYTYGHFMGRYFFAMVLLFDLAWVLS